MSAFPTIRLASYGAGVAVIVAAAIAIPLAVSGDGGVPAAHEVVPSRASTPRPASPADRQRSTAEGCRHYTAGHQFFQALSASQSGGVVTVDGHPGFVRCGGPDDISYEARHVVHTLRLTPRASVRVVRFGVRGPTDQAIEATMLPGFLARDDNGGFFRYSGTAGAVSHLVELYHP